jgi:hypothetical protein
MLLTIRAACGEYDEHTTNQTLAELRKTTWSKQTNELFSTIAEQLLHSAFEEIVENINKFMKIQ